jgi:hypothetical protein
LDIVKIGLGLGLGFLTGGFLIKTVKIRLMKGGINVGRYSGLLVWNAIPVIFWCSSIGQSLIEKLIKAIGF